MAQSTIDSAKCNTLYQYINFRCNVRVKYSTGYAKTIINYTHFEGEKMDKTSSAIRMGQNGQTSQVDHE